MACSSNSWRSNRAILSTLLVMCVFILPFASFRVAAEDNPLTEQEKAAVVNIIVSMLLDDTSNKTPNANAGSDQTVNEKVEVNLDGSASADSDGSIASYAWVQTAGATVTLSGANTAKPTFTAPEVVADETLTFELTVTDNHGATAKDSVSVVVKNISITPNDELVLAMGGSHSCALVNGGVQCWGWNGRGQLGDGTVAERHSPVQAIAPSSDVSAVSAGLNHTCAVVKGGVWCWGSNLEGQLGDGTATDRLVPVQVIAPGSGVVAIDTGMDHTCVVINGGVKCWGNNAYGQLGDGTATDRNIPVQAMASSSGVTAVTTGDYHTCAIVHGGVKCWGDNYHGQLGDGTNIDHYSPVQAIASNSGVLSIDSGWFQTCALLNGGVQCWGDNRLGQLGDGSTIERHSPVQTIAENSDVTAITVGSTYVCAVVSTGVRCWGGNIVGQLGDGTTIERHRPVQVIASGSNVAAVSAGWLHTCAVIGSRVKCWGNNYYGQLGDGTTTGRYTPVDVPFFGDSNQAPTADAGVDQEANENANVTLGGRGTDPDGDTVTYSWAQTDSSGVTATLTGATTATPSFTAPAVDADTTLIFTLTVSDGHGGTATDTVNVLVRKNVVVQPTPTGKLNDTGITLCGDYAYDASGNTVSGHTHSNSQDCNLFSDAEGDPIPPTLRVAGTGQDGHTGRDVTHNDGSDGHAGFSFTKISSTGEALPAYPREWSCVKDNVTGLIWEVKTDDGGLHDKDDRYTWYEPDGTKNGGFVGYQKPSDYNSSGSDTICYGHTAGNPATYCNTKAYVDRVNAVGWCGATDWRMPTRNELRSIVLYKYFLLDDDFFRNTVRSAFWSSSPFVNNPRVAIGINFSESAGEDLHGRYGNWGYKHNDGFVRLVRGGQ
ncbi:MAG: DUF1566 domain-containing protein [Candidatus Thiothrix sulfatifontis]|nr:MAG: DUF1566 domain-containing protein [Candidatus Thiothrix sulfatifontis]